MKPQAPEGYLPLQIAANIFGVHRNSLYVAICNGRMKALQENGRWFARKEDVQHYLGSRYDRSFSHYEGKPLFDKGNGECSIKEAAERLGIHPNAIYNFCRRGYLGYGKRGSAYILKMAEVLTLKETLPPGSRALRSLTGSR